MSLDTLVTILVVLAVPILYALAYAASTAYFRAKMRYTKDLVRSLDEGNSKNGKEDR